MIYEGAYLNWEGARREITWNEIWKMPQDGHIPHKLPPSDSVRCTPSISILRIWKAGLGSNTYLYLKPFQAVFDLH